MTLSNSNLYGFTNTRCCCCKIALKDAVSVEMGIGPICRKKYGWNAPDADPDVAAVSVSLDSLMDQGIELAGAVKAIQNNKVRETANILTRQASVHAGKGKLVSQLAKVIQQLGFVKLAEKIATNAGSLRVWHSNHPELGASIVVRAPYNVEFTNALRAKRVKRKFDKEGKACDLKLKKVWHFPVSARRDVWEALCKAFPGCTVVAPKGMSQIPQKAV